MIYETFNLSAKNPIMSNHSVYGQQLLPGLAYIDLIFQFFHKHHQHHSCNEFELRNLSIYNPLITGKDKDYDVMLSIQFSEIEAGQWQIVVEGQEQRNDGTLARDKKRYVTAEMHQTGPVIFNETLDFNQIKRSAKRIVSLEEVYGQCRLQDLVHTGFMKAAGKIYESGTATFIGVSLGQEAHASAEGFLFHPALIDGSAIGAMNLLSSLVKEEERLFLPLFFESFRAAALLQNRCVTRIQTSSLARKKELLYMTLEFFNEAGAKVAELKNFCSKLVRGAELINPDRKSHSLPAADLAAPSADSPAGTLPPGYEAAGANPAATEAAAAFLRQLMAERLKKPAEQIDTQIGYYEMGLDSPGLLEIVQAIETKIGAALSPTLLFEYTTIAELAAYLTGNYAAKFSRAAGTRQDAVPPASPFRQASTAPAPSPAAGRAATMPAGQEDIAIVGIAGRYPQAINLQEFWANLKTGKDCISEIPPSRWDWKLYAGLKSPSGKNISQWGGFIDNPDYFDPQFFRVSPREAELMDPQERLFLETCWEAIEDAGYTPKTLVTPQGPNKRRHVGVFVGVMHKDYTLIGAEAAAHGQAVPLSLNYAPIANRVSYFCNFHGPSMAVDTVCSSSLTAVHLALESIRHGDCEAALAGGVNLSLNPNKYFTYGMMDMHASDGYCHTFGKDGDGYVSGEGVGAVLLKPLHKAAQDGDHIYAVIKGSTINHVGTVSGITVPSPVAQADMIAACLEKINIHPRTISYVEAHGTGTSLGDPIEIEGLVKAFRLYTRDLQYCSIGSVKSNIGHAEAAAGISGLTKVILQLYYKTLVPSLHSEELNPHIDFAQSPFFVQHNTEEWKQPVVEEDGRQVSYPRRAGLSSFGATGSNVHIILEEYNRQQPAIPRPGDDQAIIPLSAKNKERLQAYAQKLLAFLKGFSGDNLHPENGMDLPALAYTLQVGRESMEERVAFLVKDVGQLIEKLEAFGEGKEVRDNCWRGHVKQGKDTTNLFSDRESLELINKWIITGEVRKIADLWVKGFDINWNLLYGDTKPGRISLPTYPFARERYWIQVAKNGAGSGGIAAGSGVAAAIHPLLQHNTSDFFEQRFSSTFTGQEFFLADHIVQGQRVLPGVAYLEMARVAVAQAAGVEPGQAGIRLKNIVWARPVTVGEQPVKVHIGLFPADSGEIFFEIYSQAEAAGAEPIVHSQGSAVLSPVAAAAAIDILTVQAQCNRGALSPSQCYEAFKAMGIDYGPAHRGIETVYVGPEQVLAKLALPLAVAGTRDQFVLHPSLMDSALQASIGLVMSLGDGGAVSLKPVLPFALQEIEILGNCPSSVWALIRYGDGGRAGDKVQKFDIELYDDQGKVCVRLKGLSSRVLAGETSPAQSPAAPGMLMLRPDWKRQDIVETAAPDYVQHVVMLCEPNAISPEIIAAQISGARCLTLASKHQGLAERFQDYAAQVFEEIQGMLAAKPAGRVLVQLVVPNREEQQLFTGLAGLLKTARLENPQLVGQMLEVEPEEAAAAIIGKLQANSRSAGSNHVRYQDGQRYVAGLSQVEVARTAGKLPWKDGGIYLITGGAGGLGLIFAKEIVREAKAATLILTGRSPLNGNKQAVLKELQALGARIEYRQVDVTRQEAVNSLIQYIQDSYGGLHGIIHSAGVLKDSFIIKKTKAEFLEVLAPKVAGLVYLDQAGKDLPLDFFILFSSGTGVVGNPGQADYAAANAFMDAYARYRNQLAAANQRHGQALSVNWPLWKEGGMGVDPVTEKLLRQNTGMVAMETATGIRALYQGLASGQDQVMVLEGELERLQALLLQQQPATEAAKGSYPQEENKAVPAIDQDSLPEKAVNYFKKLLAAVIKLPAHRIEADAPLEQYGIDSVMVMQLTNQLEKAFGSLPKTLFFEYQNIKDLTEYFLENYGGELTKLLGLEDKRAAAPAVNPPDFAAVTAAEKPAAVRSRPRFASLRPEKREEAAALDIAIIGVAGRYPQADNIRQFWQNLRDGKDCITEIPKERWDHSLYFDADKNKPGKAYSKWGGFINGVDQFDPLFFNISPREAQIMDPQERLFLQCVYETLEDAGYTRETLGLRQDFGLGGNVGVYVGVMYEEYQLYGAQEQIQGRPVAASGNPSSIANRVSYFCNFHGPSLAVDTMCSSSLTAIHLACQSLQRGNCEAAIAGGVNVSIHPNKYLMLSQGKFASSKGRCESFGQGGDGYVPGEGVGAVLLKPLAKAVADGDHIYGIIKGTALNHGGKTNGYTVPNPNAQASVIGRAFQEAGIDPRTISYIEAHGTGTSLGDPIEITGLTKTFQAYTQDKQFCAIGSAKSNIGHCESAAGIAGVTKILLQLKYQQLAPSLHSQTLNPNIDFSNTPFVVQQELAEWKRPLVEKGGESKEYPRIAGISSFGAGGANAHIVIEEYIPRDPVRLPIAVNAGNPAIIVLSAKNEERLREQVQQLLAAIKEQQFTDRDLADVAYTLQVGREAMEERLAVIAGSVQELAEQLKSYVDGGDGDGEVYRGQVKRNKETLAVFAADEDLAKAIDAWVAKGKYAKLLDLWVKGLIVDWNKLYGDNKPRRISLPTYPFARERYWLAGQDTKTAGSGLPAALALAGAIHPLLQRNTSDLSEQRFSSTFTGQEFFLADAIGKDQRVLPGVVCLEMARAAVQQATGAGKEKGNGIRLRNVLWARPIVVGDQAIEVHIGLYPEDNGEIAYEIYSQPQGDNAEPVVYSQGRAMPGAVAEVPPLDLTALQSQGPESGFASGPGIEKLYAGPGQVLAKLVLPAAVSDTQDQFVLHPALLAAALQASSGLTAGAVQPFALEELAVWGRCTPAMWALIRFSDSSKAGDKAAKLDIDLCDDQGHVCLRMKGLSPQGREDGRSPAATAPGTLILHPCWQEEAVDRDAAAAGYAQHVAMFCQPDAALRQSMENETNGMRFLVLESKQEGIAARFQDYAVQAFTEIQSILKEKPAGKVLIQIITSLQDEQQLFAGLGGLLKTAPLENPKLTGQLIEIEPGEDLAAITAKLAENSRRPLDRHIRYRDGKRYVAGWSETEVSPAAGKIPWQDRGVYLITGGAGGLGQIFAREIAQKVKDAALILTGRSALNENKQAELRELAALGARIEYKQVDVTQPEAVNGLIQYILDNYGSLQGIIHSAGVNKDNFILKKTQAELWEVLAPKVAGLVHLDQASQHLPLDFFVLFSSIAGSVGNVGQADYATANAFMDAYARYRNTLAAAQQRHGQTLSINWPLWQEGGMRIDAETEKTMRQNTGMIAMRTATGIGAFYQALAAGKAQVMVAEGDLSRLQARLQTISPPADARTEAAATVQVEPWLLREKTLHQLKVLFAETTKMSVAGIDPEEPLESYGIDSIMITQLNQNLDGIFGELSKTLFYEYRTLSALAEYFTADYPQKCLQWTGLGDQAEPTQSVKPIMPPLTDELPAPVSLKRRRQLTRGGFTERTADNSAYEPVAIIGMSGRYPQAKTLKDYWENLKTGRDAVTEIPPERWPIDGFYHPDPQEAAAQGKSYSKWGGFVEGFAEFDPLFFSISPREATGMDPQERLFLESCWEVLEDAGYTREQLGAQYNRRVGVFAGITKTGFELYGPELWRQGEHFYPRTSFGSVANRISYLLNLQGPSMPIDTMCSASLTAIHEACEHLYRGECEMAIAGGVNLYLHPSSYIGLCAQHMLSEDGKCKSFGQGGNGFVPGEGVGAVLLKPLSRAIADGDHIYAVIRGTSINHGGKTNGYLVPNPTAQGELIRAALDKAGVDARTVSYIEAHGTGTVLGDPIEIAGLSQAFQKDTRDTGFCAIGSVKSNIGHLEAAAGIAGIAKIVLQMQNQMIVPSLHARELNPNINFAKTPFVVQQELAEWKRPVVEKGDETKEYPRIAGISSFGAGGANAHVVLAEYIPLSQEGHITAITPQNPAIIVLSARTEDGLKLQAQQLLAVLQAQPFAAGDLADMAYTLQVGREAMEERLAVMAGSVRELAEKLQGFVTGQDGIKDLYRGQAKRNKETFAAMAVDEEMQETIEKWIQRRKYAKLLDLWVKGLSFDWRKLYGDSKLRRISLPTYPFARERYWLPEIQAKPAASPAATSTISAVIHPLLGQNTSDLAELRFTSTFTGQEFFLADHVVKGRPVLPGVAQLEMARAAVAQATGVRPEEKARIRLRDIVWARPVAAGDKAVQVHIGLYPEEDRIAYEIYSRPAEAGAEPIVHSQGIAVLDAVPAEPALDLAALQAGCSQTASAASRLYEVFKTMGLNYGPAYQGIEQVYLGQDQVLARLTLPSTVTATQDQFVLHPSLMEAALQAANTSAKPILPFTLEELEVFGSCAAAMWAHIRPSAGNTPADGLPKLDIDLCNDQGRICVRMKAFAFQLPAGGLSASGSAADTGLLLLAPCWQEQPPAAEAIDPDYAQHLVILCETDDISPDDITTRMKGVRCLALQSAQPLAERFETYAAQVFEEIQGILRNKPKDQVLIQIVVSTLDEGQLCAGFLGFLKTARLENPRLTGQLIAIEPGQGAAAIIPRLAENSRRPMDSQIRYEAGKRLVGGWQEIETATQPAIPWKNGGIYLITGGAGGLGRIFAREIARQVKDTTLILTGRSPLNAARQAQLKELESPGARVVYKQADVTREQAAADLIRSIRDDFGGLNGIIHSAGVIRDNYILKKTQAQLSEVLSPKVSGLVNLDQASKDLNLDFFVLFSSVAGSLGNPGQADYAAANAFMDHYARYRNGLAAANQRRGQTLSISWPLWQEGGMRVDANTEQIMQAATGMIPMETSTGIRAFYRGLAAGRDQVLVMEGDRQRMRELFLETAAGIQPDLAEKSIPPVDPGLLRGKTLHQLKVLLGRIAKLGVGRIDADEPLESYGIDSVMIAQLNQNLAGIFGELSKTLFFEYQTLGALAEYFVADYPQECVNWTGLGEPAALTAAAPPAKPNFAGEFPALTSTLPSISMSMSLKARKKARSITAANPRRETREPIAIIGMTGRYAQAQNPKVYWENLKAGKDCITEIPAERWPLEGFYHPDPQAAAAQGKSYSKWGSFLTGFADFDPLFFNISPLEANNMDPQERLFIESCWEVLEDAGYTKEQLTAQYNGRVGVFAGVTKIGFNLYGPDLWRQGEKLFPHTSFGSIANRISYLLNLQGPSMPIDTMCSSSLTAIHEACEHLHQQECEMAIAGGVNLYLHPSSYIGLCGQHMLSRDGKCKSFGLGGNGFVPGEGVGAVLLKPLSRAIADGDHIYAVIRGTGINHGGKTNGYTVPNPKAQGQLIRATLDKAGINARAVSYIEAHGTGTELGDPIEITGLTQAFFQDTQDTGFCAIGSVKSNIGHLEAAAGIAGVTKILLQMKHQQIVPSLHARELNPNINFGKTPFVVQQELAEWKRPVVEINGESKEYPRIAGISSFGAGGANAHVVIEEYISPDLVRPQIKVTSRNPAVIVLSAKTEDRLREQVRQLLAAIQSESFTDSELAGMAYTLQVGREAMEERLGLIAASIRELEEKLQDFVNGREGIEELYRGQVKRNKEALSVFTADEDMAKIIDAWISKGKYAKLLDLWVKGLVFDWNRLYGDDKPRRMSLPAYPFARERYWPVKESKSAGVSPATTSTGTASLHPLLQLNTSDFTRQRFSSTFTGQEFFLADHVIKGERILPGMAYLEMARTAVAQAAGVLETEQAGIRLKNVTWVRPIAAGEQPVKVHIGLFPEDSGEIAFEIYSEPAAAGAGPVVHSQGIAALGPAAAAQVWDLPAVQAQCSRNSLSSDQCYAVFRVMGVDYGPAHQGIEQLYIGAGQVLAKLSLPACVANTQGQFVLHPSLLDASSQAAIGLMMGDGGPLPSGGTTAPKPALPFALEELEILAGCTPAMWALVRYGDGSQAGDRVQKLDIDLCDGQGNVCVRLKGFSLRVLEGDLQTGNGPQAVFAADAPLAVTLMLTPVWDAVPAEKGKMSPLPTDQVVIVGRTKDSSSALQRQYPHARILDIQPDDTIETIGEKIAAHGPIDHILWLAPPDSVNNSANFLTEDGVIQEQNQGVILVFRMIKALLHLGYDARNLGWTVITIQVQPIRKKDWVNPTHASLYGLIGSMAKEYANWQVRLIDLEAAGDWPLADIFTLPPDPMGNAWAYRGQEWYREKLISFHKPPLQPALYKPGGVYVVIGGAGGIGEVWSEYMIRTYQARIVWIGRRPKEAAIQSKLNRLAGLGTTPRYITADATDKKDLQQAYDEIKQQYGQINGVIHAAIVLLDQSLANMAEERFRAGLAAKVDVSVRIAQVFQKEPLDFVMFFSSTTSFVKAAGQSNYAAGCTFKDAFARQLAREWPGAVKVINWGYWGGVGIVASRDYQERMAKLGIGSIEPPEAMDALETLLAGPLDQIALMKITRQAVMEEIGAGETMTVYPENQPSNVQNLSGHMPEQGAQISSLKTEVSRYMQEMDQFLCRLLWGQLQSAGLFAAKNSATADIKTRVGLSDMYGRWLEESIRVLARHNYLRCDEGLCSVLDTTPMDIDAAWEEWDRKKAAWMEDANTKAQVVLVEATLRALPKIITGKIPATDIMFPNSSMELVEGVYKNNIVADYFNAVLADTVVAYVEERLKQEPAAGIRILEIGAGTGGTSAMVFRKLKPYQDHIQEYCYTDISQAFLLHAKKEYGPHNPYLTYKLFNVGEPLAGQGITAGGYDLIIATNVLHATKNIRQTLRNAKAAIATNGLILLNEISGNALVTHLTFGLLEGWWLYEDSPLRIPGCPGLWPETWKAVLESEGFRSVLFPAQAAHELGQQIIVAESDGVVLQKQPELKTGATAAAMKPGGGTKVSQPNPPARQTGGMTQDLLREKSTAYIKKLVGETLQIASNKIDPSDPLEKYGIDSIIVVQLANNLGKVFDNISSTLFFEYQTIDALVEYFMSNHKSSLLSLVGLENHAAGAAADANDAGIITAAMPAPSRPAAGKSRRFLQIREPENQAKSQSSQSPQPSTVQDIAIIGISGRYPGAGNIEEFWRNLQDGNDCIVEIPKDRWDHSLYFDAEKNKPGKTYCKWGGFLEGVDQFDPLFFNISPLDAEIMDPMNRLFLETVWNLLESTGYTRDSLQRQYQSRVGVYVGAMYQQYQSFNSDIVKEAAISTASYSSIANRVSHYFNLQGPSIAIDTMCSSSAIAIHMACESLIKGDCRLAIAGGVNLTIHPKKYLGLSLTNMLGSHINSRSFAAGDGFLPAEGVGAILLKPLANAIQDRDHILAVIKSTAINHGGYSNGYTVPNPNAQAQLIEENFIKSAVHPRTISYVESAATGSALGDPIEVTALSKAFQKFTPDRQFCAIGSVKSNIGHAEAASGISQLTKVILQLRHGKLVPSIKADPLNPNINFDNTPFYLQRELQEWKRPMVNIDGEEREYPRRATVSSFGAGGSNAHLIIEEYIPLPAAAISGSAANSPQLVVISAKNRDGLQAVAGQMLAFIELNKTNPELRLPDFAYTLQAGREAMEYRLAMVVDSWEELIQGLKQSLKSFTEGKDSKETETSIPIFSGNQEEDLSSIQMLLAGKLGETMVQMLLEEKNLEKLALYWTQGGKIPWESLHAGREVRRIALPTYPFAKRRCWAGAQPEPGLTGEPDQAGELYNNAAVAEKRASLQDRIVAIICRSLGMTTAELDINKPLDKYGVDSIVFTAIFQQLQSKVNPTITLDRLLESKTTQNIINMVLSKNIDQPIAAARQANIAVPAAWPQFPELIHLNQTFAGRPVFWFHGGLGGTESYQAIAQKIRRPFYGIQARGWMTDRAPLHGIYAMAAYYIHIIQSIQPAGPYDVGGYSMGGTLAYEITRQLQELGQAVNTIVMVDSMYCPEIKKNYSPKSLLLQMVNIALATTVKQAPEKILQMLIHRDEVDLELADEAFLEQVLKLAQTRGLTKPVTQLQSLIRQSLRVRQAFKFDEFSVWPLPDPQAVTCYYFRNNSGLFWGELEPYFTSGKEDISLDHINYWEEWERQLPNFSMVDVDSSNHMVMMSDKSFEAIAVFCEKLYS
ncbi:MAG TPA: SDR family NAD(P)-dependent oxidoreductase [Methylomusa anaerophila]|uniref:SDR family NAD(P)-dependent oxidoreductase n=1 Tax=Methylomusa anaerophila TaxID=1930071 RepID=UPI002C796C29|nr:SDR family NAD(P)-dependent oxidoreductase [Methylomusa anaerophila]HML90062.1 SDR family NAD(P)-dependent oxidoreductase [Methylomusa anaerophila]